MATVPKEYPEYKPGLTHGEIVNMAKTDAYDKMDREYVHRVLSKGYFEERKAVEYWLAKEKKPKKK